MNSSLASSLRAPNASASVLVDDAAFVAADAVARPTNGFLRATTSLTKRLEDAAGAGMLAHLTVQEPHDVGAAVVSVAGAVAPPLMIHAVVMTEDEPVSRHGVHRATSSALQRAADWGIRRLTMVPFGLGAGNLDIDGSAQVMVSALREHGQRCAMPHEVVFVVESDAEAEAFQLALAWSPS